MLLFHESELKNSQKAQHISLNILLNKYLCRQAVLFTQSNKSVIKVLFEWVRMKNFIVLRRELLVKYDTFWRNPFRIMLTC